MGFSTKLDYSDNRQIKQREKTSTNLSGSTVFGLPFSGLTTGVDPNNSGVTQDFASVVSTFSGNGTTTNFTWYDPGMDIANSSISAITSTTSGETQNTGNVFVVSSTATTVDGYDIDLEYTGVSFDLSVSAIYSGAGPIYSGTVTHQDVEFLSAGTLDFKGRPIWVDNPEITRTKRLIVTNNPSIGYVLTCDNVEGEATWSSVSAATSGATFWEEDGTGNTALKDDKGGHTINGVSDNSIISGGYNNTIDNSLYSGIVGGTDNVINNNSDYSVVLGGYQNLITGHTLSYIIGGSGNTVDFSAFFGVGEGIIGSNNSSILTSNNASIIGSVSGTVEYSQLSSIVSSWDSSISGTSVDPSDSISNIIYGSAHSHIKPNGSNESKYSSIISSPNSDITGGNYSSIIGGEYSEIFNSADSVVVGGIGNFIDNSNRTSILGGRSNSAHSISNYSILIGGDENEIDNSQKSVIVGGFSNKLISVNNSVILGGENITGTSNNTVYMNNLHVEESGGTLISDITNLSGPVLRLVGDSDKLPMYSVSSPGVGGLQFGVVGITSSPAYDGYGALGDSFLYSSNESFGLNIISSESATTADYIRFYAGKDADDAGGSDIHIHGSGTTAKGYVGFATEEPTERLDVNGNARFRGIESSASAGALHYAADGTLTTNTSDERMKDGVITIDSALDKIKKLRGVYYKWNEDIQNGITDNTRVGFIAQEVSKVVPELTFINERTEDKLMGVHYQDITAILVEAVKELSEGTPIISKDELVFETQTIASEDNNIELNYNGNHESSIDGGITVVKGIDDNNDSTFMIDSSGDWTTNTHLKPNGLVVPEFTPSSTEDLSGKLGEVTRDDEYLYIKTNNGWKRTGLETF